MERTLSHYLVAHNFADLEAQVAEMSVKAVLIAALVLVVLLGIASQVVSKKSTEHLKKPLFIMIAATIIVPSLYLMGSTVYVNVSSESKGPVHWHTDIEFWACGNEIELRNPVGFLSNKIGTSTYHEHDDKRIHLEGVVIKKDYDASLEKFMSVIGGYINANGIAIPTEDDFFENDIDGDMSPKNKEVVQQFFGRDKDERAMLTLNNGDSCIGEEAAEVQAFLFRYNKNDDTYSQEKLENPARYIMRDESVVPPGDCLIVEFDAKKSTTDKLCQQYGVRDAERCTQFGVTTYNDKLCNIRQVTTSGGEL